MGQKLSTMAKKMRLEEKEHSLVPNMGKERLKARKEFSDWEFALFS